MNQPLPPQKPKSKKVAQHEALVSPPWFPDARWHLRALAIIYATLIAAYYGVSYWLSRLPKPYHLRNIPIEMTPWLRRSERHLPEERLKAPPEPEPPAGGRPPGT